MSRIKAGIYAVVILIVGLSFAGAVGLMLSTVRKSPGMNTNLHEQFSMPVTVTYFFMETCPHCKNMKPEWDKFVTDAKAAGITTREASPNTNADLVREKKVSGFPTILITVGEKDVVYPSDAQHPRTAAAIMAFVKEQTK
jgi:thiol-disulfide isomerase/thioredoxin